MVQFFFLKKVRINDPAANPLFSSGVIGKDNTIARHGIHGLYWLFEVEVPGTQVAKGNNTIFLTQAHPSNSPFQGLMYDYIRLEGPYPSNSSKNPWLRILHKFYLKKRI